jgi:ABC-type hemin transport system substrate-binding protein
VQRIVSLVPSHTETLFDLGAGGQVVGRTRFCIAPEAAKTVPHVGGTKDASLDKILALRPTLVVADKDENPKALVDALEAHGVEVLWSDIATPHDAAAFVLRLARRVGGGAEAAAQHWRAGFDAAVAALPRPASPVPVFCPIWHPWMTFDGTSYPSAMLAAAGLRNVFGDHAGPRYFEVTDAEVRAAGAAWTLLPTEPFPFHRKPVDTAGLGPCGAPGRVRVVDGEALTWFGTRTAAGLVELAKAASSLR